MVEHELRLLSAAVQLLAASGYRDDAECLNDIIGEQGGERVTHYSSIYFDVTRNLTGSAGGTAQERNQK